jgi:hypothetical protein
MEVHHRARAGRLLSAVREGFEDLPPLATRGPLLKARDLDIWAGEGGPASSADNGRKKPLVIVAVSGGGIRSAVWVFAVLKRLELSLAQRGIDFPSHVRIITGASGGMLGAGYYAVSLPPPADRARGIRSAAELSLREKALAEQQRRLSRDFLTPLVRRAALSDLPSWLSPRPSRYDRGRALEDAWAAALRDPDDPDDVALAVDFETLSEDERSGARPSLVFTPMMVEDGRRLIISNLDLRSAISNDGYVFTHKRRSTQVWDNHSLEAVELFRLWPAARGSFSVATAARMNASFPFFSPAISLPTRPRRRVVDAGYYDNYGVSLASSWLFSANNWGDYVEKHKFDSVLFIQIRDGVTEETRQLRKVGPGTSMPLNRAFEELSSPFEGLLS